MSQDYLRCTLSGMQLNGSYPSPPNILYVPYPVVLATRIIGAVSFLALDFYFDFYDFPIGSPIKFEYRSYKSLPAHWDYAELGVSLNANFAAAVAAGNLSGSYTGRYGETWNITHYQDASDDLTLPSGEGGEAGTVFTTLTPIEQGYTLPDKATTPSPADVATGVRLGTGLDWT